MWSSLDPISRMGIDQDYSDLYLLGLINSIKAKPIIKISNLKKENRTPIVLFINVDDSNSSLEDLVDDLSEDNLKYSMAANNIDLKKFNETELINYIPESVLSLDANKDLDKLNLKEAFDLIQSERFNIEELTRKKVFGLLPNNEEFSQKLLTALDLDKIDYIFGAKKVMSYDPVYFKKGSFLYYPRLSSNADAILNNPLMATSNDIYMKMRKEYNQYARFHAPYVFSVGNDALSNTIFSKGFDKFVNEFNKNLTTLASVTKWYQQKNQIEITYQLKGGKWSLKFKNLSNTETGEFGVLVQHKNKLSRLNISNIKSNDTYEMTL
jgi:hypothetical protein